MEEFAALRERLDDWLSSRPTIECQLEALRAGSYTPNWDAEFPDELKDCVYLPDVPPWQLRLAWLGEDDAHRARVVCSCIASAKPEAAEALRATLRDSLVQRGLRGDNGVADPRIRPLIVRLVMLIWIEALRAHGAKRDEAIDFVAQLSGGSPIAHSASTMRAWYDKKHGVEYTGLKQLAELVVNAPERVIYPFAAAGFEALKRNSELIIVLHQHDVLSDEERGELRSAMQSYHFALHFLLSTLNRIRPRQTSERIARRVSEIDSRQVLFSILRRVLREPMSNTG